MGNNKKGKSKPSRNSTKIQTINSDVQDFQDTLDVYRRHPSLPTLFAVIQKSLETGVRYERIEIELELLTSVDLDQFYGAHGSHYFDQYHDDLGLLAMYRPQFPNALAVSNVLWQFLGQLSGDDLLGYKKYLVGRVDYDFLCDKEKLDQPTPNEAPTVNLDSSKFSAFKKSFDPIWKGMEERIKDAQSLSEEAIELGYPMVPWVSLVRDLLPKRPALRKGLNDFSQYLDSYYANRDGIDLPDLGFASNPIKLDGENSKTLAKITAFVLLAPLFKKTVYKSENFKLKAFWSERLDYISSIESFDDIDDRSEYIVAVSNLLMICAKLGVESVTNKIVTEDELERRFLSDVTADCLNVACLAPLPRAGFAQMLVTISENDGGRPEDCPLTYALRVTDYGITGVPDSDRLDEMFDHAFQGIDSELLTVLRTRIEPAVRSWVVPLYFVSDLAYLYSNFWNDDELVEKISESLVESDKSRSIACLFPREELPDIAAQGDTFDSDSHPAIFSRKFSNAVEFVDFNDSEWIKFGYSLYLAGQTRYASTLIALYLTICRFKKAYNVEKSPKIDIPALIELLRKLSIHDSFSVVSQSIADLFEMYESVPAIYRGSIQEFLPAPKAALTPLKVKEEDRFVRHKKCLLDTGLLLDRLSNQSQDLLVKGFTLARDKELAVLNLSLGAVQNYFLAIEGELRSRSPDIDHSLAEELRYLGVDIIWKSKNGKPVSGGVFRGLGGICRAIENFAKLSESARAKLSTFRSLSTHSELNIFLASMGAFTKIRNSVQHADVKSLTDEGLAANLLKIENLLFRDGCIVRLLCETA